MAKSASTINHRCKPLFWLSDQIFSNRIIIWYLNIARQTLHQKCHSTITCSVCYCTVRRSQYWCGHQSSCFNSIDIINLMSSYYLPDEIRQKMILISSAISNYSIAAWHVSVKGNSKCVSLILFNSRGANFCSKNLWFEREHGFLFVQKFAVNN